MDAKRVLHGSEPEAREIALQLGQDPDATYRIIIDIKADEPARAYITRYVDKKSFSVFTNSDKGPEIVLVDEAPPSLTTAE